MAKRAFWLMIALSLTLGAQSQSPPALTGVVMSAEEGAMEGVLVSAKREGSTITVTVVSDAQGRYRFPAKRLAPGRYAVREEWRRLGGASLCEVALARYGATGLCAQTLGGGRDERAAALLAAAEGALLFHLGLETVETAR